MKHTINIKLRDIQKLLRNSRVLRLSKDSILKLKWMEFFLTHGESISLTARHFGIARSTFTRWAQRFDVRDFSSLEEQSRQPHHVRQPETPARVVEQIEQYRRENPTLSKEKICEKLHGEHGVDISPATVGRTILRNGFFFGESDSHRRKRRAALKRGMPVFLGDQSNEQESGGVFPLIPQFNT